MPKCSCGVVPGDCYDACGARESKISDLIRERDEARAEAAALRVDAERYRWLREKAAYVGVNPHSKTCVWTMRNVRELEGQGLDAAIDAARKESGNG